MEADILIINDMPYEFDITLKNSGGSVVLPKILFDELMIDESFLKWGFRGYLVYDNSFEQLERYKKKRNVKNSEFFYFRMDGTDEIIIELTPIFKDNSSRSTKAKQDFPIEIMSLNLTGIIYDTEDLSKDTIQNKQKKLYFWDYYYNKARYTNVRVSCGEYMGTENYKNFAEEPKDVTILNNSDRSVIASDLVKYICTDKLGADVSDEWGSCTNKTFYVSPPYRSLNDDINYLVDSCYDDIGYPPHFYFDRFNNEFNIKSYKTIFDNYQDELKENMKFADPTKPNKGVVPARSSTENTFSLPSFSNILTYKYNKMSGSDNMQELNTRILSGYNNIEKTFLTSMEWSGIESAKTLYGNLLSKFPTGNQNPLFVINEDRMANTNAIEEQALEPKGVVQKTVEAALLLNDMIHIEVLGLPNRTPGTFIEISSDTDTQGIWEDRFLGTWFVINVTHKITANGYVNNILAVKPNMSDAFKYPDGTEVEKQEIETKRV